MNYFHIGDLNNQFQFYVNDYNNFLYVGIPKNSLITFTKFFLVNEWRRVEVSDIAKEIANGKEYKFFGHIQNPHVRHTKGFVQLLFRYFVAKEYGIGNQPEPPETNMQCLGFIQNNQEALSIAAHSLIDQHTLPIWMLFRKSGIDPRVVHWIPLDHPEYTSEELTDKFFEENNIPLKCSKEYNYERRHPADENKKECYEYISWLKQNALIQEPDGFGGGFYYSYYFTTAVLSDDIEMYISALKKYGVDISS